MQVRYVREGRLIKEIVETEARVEEKNLGDKDKYKQRLLDKKAEYRNVIQIYEGKLKEINGLLTLLYNAKQE